MRILLKRSSGGKNKMAKLKTGKDITAEKLQDGRFNYGPTATYEHIGEQLVVGIPKAHNDLETVMKATYYAQKEKAKGDENVDVAALVKAIGKSRIDYVRQHRLRFKALDAQSEEELEELIKEYVPFDENRVQSDIEKSLERNGYIDNRVVENDIGYSTRNFLNRIQGRTMRKLSEKMESSPEEWENLGKHLVELGRELNMEIDLAKLFNTDKRAEKFVELYEQLYTRGLRKK